ncbi:hypothetical protein BDEG_22519 [Batrachochytrium dendrobatidis JEL423]|uniref:Uncharacterized protein n=1 Tax=Batrachochytrium dendrobatidis (strain JEL423) TaxID=403673 RepID=A0A177WET4_BATDL|nr:hypothetical protein BDEG_22519 [Batrachochytrium dendrobatidis JEL423]
MSCWGLSFVIIGHERGIPSKRESSARVDYVPALCTHRPSLLPIEWLKAGQTWSFRGSKSRNKVTVDEPAVGSLLVVGVDGSFIDV